MKKGLNIFWLIASAGVSVIGAGTLGGTYGSYQNYQSLTTDYNFQAKYNNLNPGYLKDFVNKWNVDWNKLSYSEKQQLNSQLANSRITFYKSFPTYEDYQTQMKKINSNMSDEQIKDSYDVTIALMKINYNYNADETGVIAGSVVLAIGVVCFIIFLIVFIKNKKKKSWIKPITFINKN